MICEGRYSHLPSECIKIRLCDNKLWQQAIEKSKLEKHSVIAHRCYLPNNKTWVYLLKYNTCCKSSFSEKIYYALKKGNLNLLQTALKKFGKCKYIGYTYLINDLSCCIS